MRFALMSKAIVLNQTRGHVHCPLPQTPGNIGTTLCDVVRYRASW